MAYAQNAAKPLSDVAELRGILRGVRAVLSDEAQTCRYHGSDFGFLGRSNGRPRCDSCKQPERVTLAISGIDRMLNR